MPAFCTAVGKALLAFSRPAAVETLVADGRRRLTPYTTVLPAVLLRELAEVRRTGLPSRRRGVDLGAVPSMPGARTGRPRRRCILDHPRCCLWAA